MPQMRMCGGKIMSCRMEPLQYCGHLFRQTNRQIRDFSKGEKRIMTP